ncbi:MAG TPA: hypothetical protein VFS49_05715 [Croceibacterium sp.]|nr:hypothetical protein [Croceibacterium sp.]
MASFIVVVFLAVPVLAQDPQPAPPPNSSIDVTRLGVSLSRIQRGLFIAESREKQGGNAMHLEFNVQVYGQAPKIEVLKGVDLFNGPVPGTAPSHRQVIEHLTPQIYRTPGLPISALAMWAAQHFWEKGKKTRCEEEIAEYRALVMQGVNVSAPRCTQ